MGYGKKLKAIEESWKLSAYSNSYHPIRNYLNDLVWSGKDSISLLASHFVEPMTHQEVMLDFGVGQMKGPLAIWLRKWLVGAVARALDDSFVRVPMLVLHSEVQRIGKSTFCSWLTRDVPDYFTDNPINPDDKDNRFQLAYKWIWEAAELESITNKRDAGALKAFITKQVVEDRAAYGKHSVRLKPMASFVGTANETEFLKDTTGSTRFLVASISKIDFNYSKLLQPAQVWAQAVALYRSGYDFNLTNKEASLQQEINNYYKIGNPYVDMICKHYRIETDPVKARQTEFLYIGEIVLRLELDQKNSGHMRLMASALQELGAIRGRVRDKDEVDTCKAQGLPRPHPQRGYWGLIRLYNPLTLDESF